MIPFAPSSASSAHPRPQAAAPASYCVIGAHGGAGASTVACWLRSDQTTVYEGAAQGGPGRLPVVVCRYTAQEMLRLTAYLASWPTGGVPRPWLVLMRDAPVPPPRPARFRRRALGARVLGVTEVPYLVPLRSVDSPEEGLKFRVVAQAAVRLRRDLGL